MPAWLLGLQCTCMCYINAPAQLLVSAQLMPSGGSTLPTAPTSARALVSERPIALAIWGLLHGFCMPQLLVVAALHFTSTPHSGCRTATSISLLARGAKLSGRTLQPPCCAYCTIHAPAAPLWCECAITLTHCLWRACSTHPMCKQAPPQHLGPNTPECHPITPVTLTLHTGSPRPAGPR